MNSIKIAMIVYMTWLFILEVGQMVPLNKDISTRIGFTVGLVVKWGLLISGTVIC